MLRFLFWYNGGMRQFHHCTLHRKGMVENLGGGSLLGEQITVVIVHGAVIVAVEAHRLLVIIVVLSFTLD